MFYMNKIFKYSTIISIVFFLILALILLFSRACQSEKVNNNPGLNRRLISDSESFSVKFDVTKTRMELNEVRVQKFSNVIQIPNNQYVRGNIGLYYVIDLKDTVS